MNDDALLQALNNLFKKSSDGISYSLDKLDSVTGAPTRALVGGLQQGKGLLNSGKEFVNHFGGDNSTAPTASDIQKGFGIPDVSFKEAMRGGGNPMLKLAGTLMDKNNPIAKTNMSEFLTGAATDYSNFIPAAPVAMGLNKVAHELGLAKNAFKFTPEVRQVLGDIDYSAKGLNKKFAEVTPEEFLNLRQNNKRASFLSDLKAEDLQGHKLYASKDGVGFAISPEGDLQNVFNNSTRQGAGKEAVLQAINKGAKTLDAFDGFLPQYYNDFGFKVKNGLTWNDEFAPKNWNYEKYGRPDVTFMEFPENLSRDPGKAAARFGVSRNQRITGSASEINPSGKIEFDSPYGTTDWSQRGDLGKETFDTITRPANSDALAAAFRLLQAKHREASQ